MSQPGDRDLAPELRGARVTLRAITPADVDELVRIHRTPAVAEFWDEPDAYFPFDDEPDTVRFAIEVDGAIAGLIQYGEETEPKYRHAFIDIFLDPARHGQGLGTEALRLLCRHLIDDRGHHRITIDPAAHNAAAVRSYQKAGFKPVGILRQQEFDFPSQTWHDSLLMDMLREDLAEE